MTVRTGPNPLGGVSTVQSGEGLSSLLLFPQSPSLCSVSAQSPRLPKSFQLFSLMLGALPSWHTPLWQAPTFPDLC